jgi:hypothetical protein
MMSYVEKRSVDLNKSLISAPLTSEFFADDFLEVSHMALSTRGKVCLERRLHKRAQTLGCGGGMINVLCHYNLGCPMMPAFDTVSVDNYYKGSSLEVVYNFFNCIEPALPKPFLM